MQNSPLLTAELAAMNLNPTEQRLPLRGAAAHGANAPAGMKFTYPSGARPLDGYTIKRGIGHGGFGEVYYAVSDAGKDVALKLVRRNLDIELRGVRQCLNLKHPHLLALHDIRVDEQGNSWVVMEYVAGQCLEDVLNSYSNGLPTDQALVWLHGIGAAVDYLHDHGIVHRDLKPGNIFNDEGMVKIGDYGLSKFVSVSRRSGQTESVGTVHYMAPEIANGRYGKEIDIYALGVLLYELLTGHVPFEGESVGEVLMKHLTAQPDLSRLSEPYRSVCRRALEKDPALRYASVREMLAALPQGPSGNMARVQATVPAPRPAVTQPQPKEQDRLAQEAYEGRQPMVHAARQANAPEPVAQTLRDVAARGARLWRRAGFSAPVKAIIFVIVLVAMLRYMPLWMPWALILGAVYLVYRGIWKLTRSSQLPAEANAGARPLQWTRPDSSPPARRVPPQAQHHRQSPFPSPRLSWRQQMAMQLRGKPLRQRAMELSGAMLLAAAVTTVVSLLLATVAENLNEPEQLVWLMLVSTIGSWLVLAVSKSWEGEKGDSARRRFTMLVLGLVLGAAAWTIHSLLMLSLPYEGMIDVPAVNDSALNSPYFFDAAGQPELLGFMAYFGLLMVVMRWWVQADPLRGARVSLWTTLLCALAAWLIGALGPFPQPWGWMTAATMSLAVQLASPWLQKPKTNPFAEHYS